LTYLNFDGVSKIYDDGTKAVSNFNLEISEKEFVVLVGPSGCGKSTTLRMLAGLEKVTSGKIMIDGNIINDLPPSVRDIGMVFQSYALYPHLNVEQNLSFGLKLQQGQNKIDKEEIESRVSELSKILGLSEILEKMPKSLSGGQRQRVALGRALAKRPKVILMDEPLSNLDAKLRSQMRIEIRRLHDELGMTTVYVTHDQVEAMTLADRIVVMKDGEIQQVDPPLKSYHHPSNTFVASFLGTPPMNMLKGTVSNGTFRASNSKESKLTFKKKLPSTYKSFEGDCFLGFRPENTTIILGSKKGKFSILGIESLGSESVVHIYSGNIALSAIMHKPDAIFDQNLAGSDSKIDIEIDDDSMRLFDFEGNSIKEK
tara:strand:- start:1199 stop:2311 length:1113 start_codon:yes stop_codon:yes gene_type:complete